MENNHIDYVEFKALDLEVVKNFYAESFGWSFQDFGPAYVAFSGSGLKGGFEKVDGEVLNGALVVLYHSDLAHIKEMIEKNGGTVTKDIFAFPGGQRFHFQDPVGNELAVWSDQ